MGRDGVQTLTIYGPKEDIDALEACGCELTEEQANIPYPALEGEYCEVFQLVGEDRPRYFELHTRIPDHDPHPDRKNPAAEVKRIHSRKLTVNHVYRNRTGNYNFFVLLLANYPKCCLKNWVNAEEAYRERLMLRFTPKGTVRVEIANWNSAYCYESPPTRKIEEIKTSLDRSFVRYKLRIGEATGDVLFLFKYTLGIKQTHSGIWPSWPEYHFVSKNQSWDPTLYVNILRKRYPECIIHGTIDDQYGRHVEVIDSRDEGYGFRQWTDITKKDEFTLDDFSLK